MNNSLEACDAYIRFLAVVTRTLRVSTPQKLGANSSAKHLIAFTTLAAAEIGAGG
jgi:hypothetical protein